MMLAKMDSKRVHDDFGEVERVRQRKLGDGFCIPADSSNESAVSFRTGSSPTTHPVAAVEPPVTTEPRGQNRADEEVHGTTATSAATAEFSSIVATSVHGMEPDAQASHF